MKRCVIDTNVPVVANGRSTGAGIVSLDCRISTVTFLQNILLTGKILIDLGGAIQREYRTHLNPSGQPGVGDRFYQAVLNSAPRLIERVDLPMDEHGEYIDLPHILIEVGFDPSDRKFAALSAREHVPIINGTDSDWVIHRAALESCGVLVEFLCGCDVENWFDE